MAEAQIQIYAQGNPGVEQLSPEHYLVLVPGILHCQRPLVSTFSFSEAGLWEVALLSMALGEMSALSGLQLPHV